jgi:hypothetical protein
MFSNQPRRDRLLRREIAFIRSTAFAITRASRSPNADANDASNECCCEKADFTSDESVMGCTAQEGREGGLTLELLRRGRHSHPIVAAMSTSQAVP